MLTNELTLEPQVFDAKLHGMDKSLLAAPLSFFDALNTPDDSERLRRMKLLRARALEQGMPPQEYEERCNTYLSNWEADPGYCLTIARAAKRREAMHEVGLTPMAYVETRQAEYLIEPYLPLDAITILAGVAGAGKTWLALKWAADISAGRATKDGQPGLVYYFTQENDPHIVLAPRLEKLGARLENIAAATQISDVPTVTMCDPRLEELAQNPTCHPALVVFDPIQSYLEKHVKMNQADDVRPMMDYLARFAARHHCAVLLISHINKPSLAAGSASDRILGSSDFRNAARSIIFAGNDPEDPDTRVFAQDKNSLGPAGPSMRFAIRDGGVEIMDKCDFTADEIIRPRLTAPRGPAPTTRDRAVGLLGELLKTPGWVKASDAYRAAEHEGISETTLRKAFNEMKLARYEHNKGLKGSYTIWYQPRQVSPAQFEQLALARVDKTQLLE